MGLQDRDYMKKPAPGGSGRFSAKSGETEAEDYLQGFLNRHPNLVRRVIAGLCIFFVVMLVVIVASNGNERIPGG